MIYLFFSDEAFANAGSGSVMSYETLKSQGLGMLTDNLLNYFVDHTVIADPAGATTTRRTSRLAVDAANAGNKPYGRIYLHVDASKLDSTIGESLDMFNPASGDSDAVRATKLNARAALFNITEYIFYAHSETHPNTLEDINDVLIAASGSTYEGYVADSLKLSSTSTKATYRYLYEGSVAETQTLAYFHDYCEFSFRHGNGEGDVLQFRIYLNSNEFSANYPYSTITDVIYPCAPAWILNPENSGGQVQAVIAAANYKDAQLDTAITDRDHSGLAIYTSRYVHTSVATNARMGFVVLYKGCAPTSTQMRLAIREKLLAETDEFGTYLGTDNEWKERLPDLFVDAGFYLFPCYFQRVPYPGGTTIERNIVSFRELYNKTCMLRENRDTQEVFDSMEILQSPGHDIYFVALPVESNGPEYQNVRTLHPTYQAIDSVGVGFTYTKTPDTVYTRGREYYYQTGNSPVYEYHKAVINEQDYGTPIPEDVVLFVRTGISTGNWGTMTASSKEFAQLISNCLTACLDADSMWKVRFTQESIDGREYLSFVASFIEYHMLTLAGAAGVFDVSDN